ncbi:fungal specific transcription factor domain protein [Cladophialophora carrionii]|uniref:Fungal specific transcription factor domain protein n=1 Tax=Cladophialophora carrionii TaxID=86049 RepID=A0A1C1CP15_9EURO|nr:fungal specific transcription factor domain protein [Cladophialophora carrionii]
MPTKRITESERRRCVKACDPCKRRKERCSGARPCNRCVVRSTEDQCQFTEARPPSKASERLTLARRDDASAVLAIDFLTARRDDDQSALPSLSPATFSIGTGAESPRLTRDHRGGYVFIGDSASMSLLQDVRRLVSMFVSDCAFVNDHNQNVMLESLPLGRLTPHPLGLLVEPARPSLEAARVLVSRYCWTTSCFLDLFDESDLLERLPSWISAPNASSDPSNMIFHLILAIGLQSCNDDNDDLAESHFKYAKCALLSNLLEDPSITVVQAHALIVLYLIAAAQRNAACMYLGLAVQGAHALGLHRGDAAAFFSPHEFRVRERLWKTLRTLDGHLSYSLGRPILTVELRDPEPKTGYSSLAGLTNIFSTIMQEVYDKRRISADTLGKVTRLHRNWTRRLSEGLTNDGIPESTEIMVSGVMRPNIGLFHVKSAYYLTIILMTRHCLLDQAQARVQRAGSQRRISVMLPNTDVLVEACVSAAMGIVQIYQVMKNLDDRPKRLPLLVHSTFQAALVLGIAYFAELDTKTLMEKTLRTAHDLLALFGKHDPLAQKSALIVEKLLEACELYAETGAAKSRQQQAQRVMHLFGDVDNHHLRSGDEGTALPRSHLRVDRCAGETAPAAVDASLQPLSQLEPIVAPGAFSEDSRDRQSELFPLASVDSNDSRRFVPDTFEFEFDDMGGFFMDLDQTIIV